MPKDYPSISDRDERSESDFPSELEQTSEIDRDFPKEYQLHLDNHGNEHPRHGGHQDSDVVSHINDSEEETTQYDVQTSTSQTCRTCGETTEACGCETCRTCGETTTDAGCGCETCRTCGETSESCECETCRTCGKTSETCGCETCHTCGETTEACDCDTCHTCGETTEACGCDAVLNVYDNVEVKGDVAKVRDSVNSFDQVARDIAQDLQVFDQVEDKDLRHLAELIPERNHDRLFSQAEETPDESQAVSEIPEEEPVEMPEHHDSEDDAQPNERDVPPPYEAKDEPKPEPSPRVERKKKETKNHHASDDDLPEMPAPPSFIFRSERLSKNVADAMANVWDRFWAEDVKQIGAIIKNRFSQLMPYIRRFLAHIVAFWGGITYIRRALAAFIRILNRDERVRELLERIGWASATTVRVFLSICAMTMQATLQTYYLVRNKIIPDARRVVPILYYKAIVGVTNAAKNSPWALYFGPFSLTFAIDEAKVPDRYYLHNKLSVPEHDVSFGSGSVQSFVQSMRDTIHRTATIQRSLYSSSSASTVEQTRGSPQSTPVHTQSTDEMPYPPPDTYTVSSYTEGMPPSRRLSGHGKSLAKSFNKDDNYKENYYAELARKTPLTERTNSQHTVRI